MPGAILIESDAGQIPELIEKVLNGDDDAADHLCRQLCPAVRRALASFRFATEQDQEDIAQETLVAVISFLRRSGGFDGDLIRFATTIARNRCRNLYHWRRRWKQVPIDSLEQWIADPTRNPLEMIEGRERLSHLQRALDDLSQACRQLIRAFYLQERPMVEILRDLEVGSVQALYYRRRICLKKLLFFLKKRLGECSQAENARG